MPTLARDDSSLLVIDLQGRLVPALDGGPALVERTAKLMRAAGLLAVPVLLTEQNPKGLGPTVPDLDRSGHAVLAKTHFDASRAEGFFAHLPERPEVVVTGAEAHVCVLQTVLGLIGAGRRAYVVEDAVGSRAPASKAAALRRMARAGAEIVTTEMVLFEWLEDAGHPRFREIMGLVK
ncbi:hypothetical protein OPKNFCMD_5348 [Methylobacterium crusticola]|uniref:Isochorismatase-like domain-containing protein n=1 Tax=Methylobacterium crusticola TaxID=1697972 RepID=A0ABQ4R759_9HYPH|nr:isochorismatase family protein [Methylobacterium crusticola]GJD52582.1 hypothetical protein OPKNFCMD_5348 [Methylobacterium crusticola]